MLATNSNTLEVSAPSESVQQTFVDVKDLLLPVHEELSNLIDETANGHLAPDYAILNPLEVADAVLHLVAHTLAQSRLNQLLSEAWEEGVVIGMQATDLSLIQNPQHRNPYLS